MSANETDAPSSDGRDPIELLADSFIARFRTGERPSIDEYARRYVAYKNIYRDEAASATGDKTSSNG